VSEHRCCAECEELLQLYIDGELSDEEARETEAHLDDCGYCARHYRFERLLRARLQQAANEPIPPELMTRLTALRQSVP